MVQPRTADERFEALAEFAGKFNQHLLATPGIVLNGKLRLAVAIAARDALFCQGCAELRQDACLYHGVAYAAIGDLEHGAFPMNEAFSAPVCSALLELIHAVINHQSKLDATWYTNTIKALDNLCLIDKHYTGQSRRSLLCSLYCEVVTVSMLSHAVHIVCVATGRPAFPLPAFDDFIEPLKPTMRDITTLFRKGRMIRQDEVRGFAPYFLAGDLDPHHVDEYLGDGVYRQLKGSLTLLLPFLGLGFAPLELLLLEDLCKLHMYDEVHVSRPGAGHRSLVGDPHTPRLSTQYAFRPHNDLDPKVHCSDVFTRYDKETVAVAMTETYDCSF